MKWIALINRHLEVRLQLIKSGYLSGEKEEESKMITRSVVNGSRWPVKNSKAQVIVGKTLRVITSRQNEE